MKYSQQLWGLFSIVLSKIDKLSEDDLRLCEPRTLHEPGEKLYGPISEDLRQIYVLISLMRRQNMLAVHQQGYEAILEVLSEIKLDEDDDKVEHWLRPEPFDEAMDRVHFVDAYIEMLEAAFKLLVWQEIPELTGKRFRLVAEWEVSTTPIRPDIKPEKED